MWRTMVLLMASGAVMASPVTRDEAADRAAINAVLTDFHVAAGEPDPDRYFGHFTDDAIFYGTDPGERWTVEEFRAYAKPIHDQGRGWVYHLESRNIFISAGGDAAWFDEIVRSDHYGACRGTGALVREGGTWKIAQYNLVIPVPNDFADPVVLATQRGVSEPKTIVLVRHMEKASGINPGLNDAGRARLARLTAMLSEFRFDAVYTTDFKRTRNSAEPFARAAGVELSIVPGRDAVGLARRITDDDSGATSLVVGHSDTIPAWLTALGVRRFPAISTSEYDDFFMVQIDALGRVTMTHLHY